MDGTILEKKYNIIARIEALEEGGGGGGYVLPTATDKRLGGIKVGSNLTVGEDGTLSAPSPTPPYTPPAYSTNEVNSGVKWIDGKDIFQKVIVLEEAIAIDANAWHTVEALSAEQVLKVDGISVDECTFPCGGVCQNGNLEVLNLRNTAIEMVAFIVYYVKTPVSTKKKSK